PLEPLDVPIATRDDREALGVLHHAAAEGSCEVAQVIEVGIRLAPHQDVSQRDLKFLPGSRRASAPRTRSARFLGWGCFGPPPGLEPAGLAGGPASMAGIGRSQLALARRRDFRRARVPFAEVLVVGLRLCPEGDSSVTC